MENKKNNQPLDLAVTDPEWTAITTAFAGQEVPAASPLTGKERWLCVLSALLGCQGMGAFRKALGSALDDGVEPVAVREVIYQATAYLGIGRVQDFLLAAGEVMMQHGIALPLPAQGTAGADARFDKGLAKQVALFTRTHRGLVLTEAGKSLYKDSKYIIRYCKASVLRAKSAGGEEKVIRIGTSPMTPGQFLVDLWPKVHSLCPDIKFELVPYENTPENAREILANLGQNIDIVAGPFDARALQNWRCAALLKVVPVRWKFTIPFGILHAPAPSPTVERFLEAIRQVTGAGEELPGGR